MSVVNGKPDVIVESSDGSLTVTQVGKVFDLVVAGGSTTWADVLSNGAVSGGTNPILSNGDSIQGEDEAASDAGATEVRGGDYTTADASAFDGGPATFRAGDTASANTSARGGDFTARSGNADGGYIGTMSCTAGTGGRDDGGHVFGGGTLTAGSSAAGETTFRGTDNTGSGGAGGARFRGGDATDAGSGSDNGGAAVYRGGRQRNAGTPGATIIRSPGPTTGSAGTTGDVTISTQTSAITGDPEGAQGQGATDTGSVRIATGPCEGNSAGDIDIEAGSTSATSGNSPGNVSASAGSMNTSSQSNVGGGTFTCEAGDSAGDSNSPGGDVDVFAGDQTGNGSSVGGSVNLWGGDSDTGSGDAGDVTLRPGVVTGGGSGNDGVADVITGDGGSLRVRTQTTGYEETGDERKTYAEGTVTVPASSSVDVVTLGTVDTNGRNMKFSVEVTAVDDADDSVVSATVIMQTAYRSGGTVSLMTSNMNDKQTAGGSSTDSNNITFGLKVSGDDVVLEALNADGVNEHAAHVTVRWSRQLGGVSS